MKQVLSNLTSQSFWKEQHESMNFQQVDWYFEVQKLKFNNFNLLSYNKENEILVVGIGTSSIIDYFSKQGFLHLIFIDYCESLIDNLSEKYLEKHPGWDFGCCEISNLSNVLHEDIKFDLIIDKGCIDILLLSSFKEGKEKITKSINELYSLLSKNGSIVIFSVAEPELILPIIKDILGQNNSNYSIVNEEIVDESELSKYFNSEDNTFFLYKIIKLN